MERIQTDIVVLGAGPGGYAAAFRAADLGKNVTLVERYPTLWVLEPSFPRYLRDVVRAISDGDEAAAVQATHAYYARVDGMFRSVLASGAPRPTEELPAPRTAPVVPLQRRKAPA